MQTQEQKRRRGQGGGAERKARKGAKCEIHGVASRPSCDDSNRAATLMAYPDAGDVHAPAAACQLILPTEPRQMRTVISIALAAFAAAERNPCSISFYCRPPSPWHSP